MPEPDPHYPPSVSHKNPQPAYSYAGDSLKRNDTFESTSSTSSGRQLPHEPGYTNGKESAPDEKRMRGKDYLSHHNSANSQTSYSSSGSLASYSTKATSVTGEGPSRPSGKSAPALPPKPSAFRNELPDSRYQYQSTASSHDHGPGLDRYPQEYESRPQAPPKPPVPPKVNYLGEFSTPLQISACAYMICLPMHCFSLRSVSDFDLQNPGSSFDSQQQSSVNPYINPEVGAQNLPDIADPRADEWDPAAAYGDGRGSYIVDDDNETAGPSDFTRRPSDLLHSLATYDDNPLDLKDPSQDDGYWEDEDEDDESRFVNFSLLSHIAMQLRDKVPRGTHVKGSVPYPRAFTGKDIVVCGSMSNHCLCAQW